MDINGLLASVFRIYYFILLARIFMSWIPGLSENPIGQMIYQVTEPVLGPIRGVLQQFLPPSMGMIDFSPIVVIILMNILQGALR